MIKGVGTDLVEKKRVNKLFQKYGDRFVNRILTKLEKEEFEKRKDNLKRVSFLSNNFACKEAVVKVLDTGASLFVSLRNIEVLRQKNGSPYLNLYSKANERALEIGCKNFKLSISDTDKYSLALVIGEGEWE